MRPSARCDMVASVTDKNRLSSTGPDGPHACPDAPRPEPLEFEQLTLDPTIIGPGTRTEDHYERGAALKIKGERGVFKYRYASVSRAGLVSLHLVGDGGCRAVRPDQVTPVRKTRPRTLREQTLDSYDCQTLPQ
jgi:hypothetical protein